MSRTVQQPEVIDSQGTGTGRWMVVIFNNDYTPQEIVIEVLMRSTGCGTQEAFIEMWEAEVYGKSSVHFAEKTECEIVAAMISSVGVKTQVRKEWEE